MPPNGAHRSRSALILAGFAVLLAAAALALWVNTWLQSRSVPEYTPEQRETAQSTACSAYTTVRTGVANNTNLASPDGGVTGSLAAAANARVALIGGGQYVLARVGPATPTDLADRLQDFGNKLMDFGAAATAGALNTDPGQVALLAEIDALNTTLGQLCG
jgi:hypothetical protein